MESRFLDTDSPRHQGMSVKRKQGIELTRKIDRDVSSDRVTNLSSDRLTKVSMISGHQGIDSNRQLETLVSRGMGPGLDRFGIQAKFGHGVSA
jgi:hypothetical protein